MDANITTQTSNIRNVYSDFSATTYGQKLHRSIRFERYNLGNLSHDEWCSLLGPDVNNLEHMLSAYRIAERLIAQEDMRLSEGDENLLLLTAIIHDQAESLTGDITYGDKTRSHAETERELFRQHIDKFAPHATIEIRSMMTRAVDTVIFDDTSTLGKIFNTIERIGYVETAIRAHTERAHNTSLGPATRRGLSWLVADVLHNQIQALIRQPHAHHFLLSSTDITDAFTSVPSDTFALYGDNQVTKQQQFDAAHSEWRKWRKSSS